MNDNVSMPGHLRVGLGNATPAANEHILSQVRFSIERHQPSSPQLWPIGLERLLGPAEEHWYVDTPVQSRHHNGFTIQDSTHWAWLGCERACNDATDFATLANEMFMHLHHACAAIGKPHVTRVWVVIPDIHRGAADQERYKQFCLGRHRAYVQLGLSSPNFPAATVIGGHTGILRFQVLSASQAGFPVENPRQTSAYEYPREYGPSSPTFSRAMKLTDCTLVSGTAAIRGADSRHPEDTAAQIQEIADNLTSLQGAAASPLTSPLSYARLYLREPQDLHALSDASQQAWSNSPQWPVLKADICRKNLRCEIETVFPV